MSLWLSDNGGGDSEDRALDEMIRMLIAVQLEGEKRFTAVFTLIKGLVNIRSRAGVYLNLLVANRRRNFLIPRAARKHAISVCMYVRSTAWECSRLPREPAYLRVSHIKII